MKKIARLQWIQERFGEEFVLPYKVCTTWKDISLAISEFEKSRKTWGLRTDIIGGTTQGYLQPFLLNGTRKEAQEIWRKSGNKLIYIVCENVLSVVCHGVAIPIDKESVFFEYNSSEPTISQRAMYQNPQNLRHIVIGYGGHAYFAGRFYRSVSPVFGSIYRFDTVYELALCIPKVDEITFTVRSPDRRLVLW
ncbi:MAG: hypothetical protein AAB407_00255 [Patescibacteria group bacterium]